MAPLGIIYDLGSNNGDDLPYYLKKADLVVAVEANPALCDQIRRRFVEPMEAGRLFVENCVLNVDDLTPEVDFYIHQSNHVLSRFPPPDPHLLHEFDKVRLPSKSITNLIRRYGAPYYVKIDIEGFDGEILKSLFLNQIFPPFISAESHSPEVFSLLVGLGKYNAFKLVNSPTVSQTYKNHPIAICTGSEPYSFPVHSAGPFGEDVAGDWMTAECFLRLLAIEGFGWKDIHATNIAEPSRLADPKLIFAQVVRVVVRHTIKPLVPERIWVALMNLRFGMHGDASRRSSPTRSPQ